jgi:RNA polymerase sigma factor (sigma-70 family)
LSIAFDSPSPRPDRAQIEPVALDLIRRRGAEVLSSARRYAPTPDDAEDAYQRALEILLTKAPTTREDELLPWLKTVVRHECYALRKKRERDVPLEHDALDGLAGSESHAADARAESYDRLRVGAEALGRLKPQETRALLLKAEGLSYQEIAAQTGWTYTKVNRCLVEGRRAFVARVAGIESGAECERLEPLLSALADGEASAEDMAALRPHLRGCSSCRATLRDYREAPARVRDLGGGVAAAGIFGWLADRVWSELRSLFEIGAAQKVAAVAASTAVVAGGGATAVQAVGDAPPQRAAKRAEATAVGAPVRATTRAPAATAPAPAASAKPPPTRPERRVRRARRRSTGAGTAQAPVRPAAPAPSAEPATAPTHVTPEPNASRSPASPTPAREPEPAAGEFGP